MIVLTTLLTSTPDPQRSVKWECDPALVETLARSCERLMIPLYVLHDEDPVVLPPELDYVTWARIEAVDPHPNPYFARWQAITEFTADSWRNGLTTWCVDATDVTMLRRPEVDPDAVYVGSEPSGLDNAWLTANHPSIRSFARAFAERPLHNAGLLGGPVEHVHFIARAIERLAHPNDLTDMAAFNVVTHAWPGPLVTGAPVHTTFKAYEHNHPTAWWAHK